MRATVASNISVRCASVSSDANTNSLMKYGAQSWFASVNNRCILFSWIKRVDVLAAALAFTKG